MVDFDNMSSDELARAVDEYIKRAIATVRVESDLHGEKIMVQIIALQYNVNDTYDITHTIEVRDDYGKKPKHQYKGNNVIRGGVVISAQAMHDIDVNPTQVTPMLPAPIELVSESAND